MGSPPLEIRAELFLVKAMVKIILTNVHHNVTQNTLRATNVSWLVIAILFT